MAEFSTLFSITKRAEFRANRQIGKIETPNESKQRIIQRQPGNIKQRTPVLFYRTGVRSKRISSYLYNSFHKYFIPNNNLPDAALFPFIKIKTNHKPFLYMIIIQILDPPPLPTAQEETYSHTFPTQSKTGCPPSSSPEHSLFPTTLFSQPYLT